eukprot:jgi/Bigna1/89565/estExt_fgenesh1_pg.C_510129
MAYHADHDSDTEALQIGEEDGESRLDLQAGDSSINDFAHNASSPKHIAGQRSHHKPLAEEEDEEMDVKEGRRRRSVSEHFPRAKPIGSFEAYMHLVRGNLGPGALNLPYAFARVGWLRGLLMLLVVSAQGIYSMNTLLRCKRALKNNHRSPETYMDVGYMALGKPGRAAIQTLVAVLQFGVCCVFLQLVSTNLEAGLQAIDHPIAGPVCTLIVTGVMIALSMLRRIQNMKWLTIAANAMMLIALFSGTIEAFVVLHDTKSRGTGSGSATDVFFFLSSLFYAYEGIAIIMPVENSFCRTLENSLERSHSFQNILVAAMATVAFLMLIVGASCGAAFPGIESGSITAYLSSERNNPWFKVVNILTLIAVLMTFPLQLYPAVEVINEWFGPRCKPTCCQDRERKAPGGGGGANSLNDHRRIPESEVEQQDTTNASMSSSSASSASGVSRSSANAEWIIRRIIIVMLSAAVSLGTNNLGLLVALVGSVGSPGLVMMPNIIHLRLQFSGQIAMSYLAVIGDILVITFALIVGVAGTYFAITQLVNAHNSPDI